MLFDGGSGTGKTINSNVFATVSAMVADDVDLVTMLSIWIGETEKNVRTTLAQTDKPDGVLFVEADMLLG